MGSYLHKSYEGITETNNKQDNVKEKIESVFDNAVPVIFATDENFIPYLYVTIQSLIDNSNKKNNYDIVILYEKVSEYKQRQFKNLESNNISIRFVNMSNYMEKHSDSWYTHWRYSSAVYYRFFITKLFEKYDKVLYLDSDIIINFDITELYNIDLGDNYLGAIQDISQQMKDYSYEKYREKILKIKREEYFNAGILCFNLKKLKEFDFTKKCIETLIKLEKPIFQDQDVLNYICNGNVKYLDFSYNLLWNCINYHKDAKERIKPSIYNDYIKSWQNPKIIHYAGNYKPWEKPHLSYAEYFWKYARKTPYYEELLYKHSGKDSARKIIKNVLERKKIYWKYIGCRFLKIFANRKNKEFFKTQISILKKTNL